MDEEKKKEVERRIKEFIKGCEDVIKGVKFIPSASKCGTIRRAFYSYAEEEEEG